MTERQPPDLAAIVAHLDMLPGLPEFKAGRMYVEDAPTIRVMLAELSRLRLRMTTLEDIAARAQDVADAHQDNDGHRWEALRQELGKIWPR